MTEDYFTKKKEAKEFINSVLINRNSIHFHNKNMIADEEFSRYNNNYDYVDYDVFDKTVNIVEKSVSGLFEGDLSSILPHLCMQYKDVFGKYPNIEYAKMILLDGSFYLRIVIDGIKYKAIQNNCGPI